MVARLARLKVPRFKSLCDFLLAQKYYFRALFMPGPERSDPGLLLTKVPFVRRANEASRMRRHRLLDSVPPEFSFLQIPFKPAHKTHIRYTSAASKPERD